MISAHPLTWPEGWKRTPSHGRKTARFTSLAKRLTIADGVRRVLSVLAIGWHLYDSAIQKPARASTPQPLREPYIATNTKLGEQERLRVVVVPHPLGKAFDVRCLIYNGNGTAQMVCPNVTQEQLTDVEDATPRGAR